MNTKSQLPMPSFVGSASGQSSPPLCFTPPAKVDKNIDQPMLCCCRKAPRSQCMAAIGVLILLLGYTVAGALLFVSLEGEVEEMDGVETAASKPYPRNNDLIYNDLRTRTVNQLWSITEDLNILYRENWTRLAAQEIKQFQENILHALKIARVQQVPNVKQPPQHKWSYASAFLYSLTLITTIGYGSVTPLSQWGRLVQVFNLSLIFFILAALLYALLGIPIILLYLSTMGEGLSSAMRCIFKRLRASSSKGNSSSSSNSNSTSSSTTTPSSSTSNNILGGSVVDPSTVTAAANNSNKSKIMEVEKRQYASWNLNGGGGYNNNYLSSSITVGSSHHKKQKQSAVPISICIMILVCYITCGAAVFHELQKWSVLESIYFCFTALSTIGFGDLQPKNEIGLYVASVYIILGMAIVAMCFSLIQTELVIWMRKFNNAHEKSSHHDDEITLANVTITPIKS